MADDYGMGPGEKRASERNAIALLEQIKLLHAQAGDLAHRLSNLEKAHHEAQGQMASLHGLIAANMGSGPTAG